MIRLVTSARAVNAAWEAAALVGSELTPPTPTAAYLPDGARSWLAALRLLSGVPFQHLVADTRLLPLESARFFFVDRGWTDALIQGALSVGAVTDADRAVLQTVYPAVRDDLDVAERSVRVPGGEQDPNTPDTAPDDPSRLHIMRFEALAPGVLLVIFDGTPAVVHIDEPRHGIQFGVDEAGTSTPGAWSYQVTMRPNAGSGDLTEGTAAPVAVPFRANAPGVIDLTTLQQDIAATGLPETATAFALQMIRMPYRQVLGPITAGPPPFTSVFEATVSIEAIREWPHYATLAEPAGDEPAGGGS
jgi:hypothetical protein